MEFQHPCFERDAHCRYGRIHLPVAPACNIQCVYCKRLYDCPNESRPGVCSRVETPDEAAARAAALLKKYPQYRVIGIAGPGEPLANEETSEALYAIVNQVMEPQECRKHSINIETLAWGSDGNRVLREMEAFLGKSGITVQTWIPSASPDQLRQAPAAQLNLAKRVRWAKRMKERFGVDYLFLGNGGSCSG